VLALNQIAARSSAGVATRVATADIYDGDDPVLPALGPIVPERPELGAPETVASEPLPALGYAEMRVERASDAFRLIVKPAEKMTPSDIIASWKRAKSAAKGEGSRAG
jgi:rare lipoprotein A